VAASSPLPPPRALGVFCPRSRSSKREAAPAPPRLLPGVVTKAPVVRGNKVPSRQPSRPAGTGRRTPLHGHRHVGQRDSKCSHVHGRPVQFCEKGRRWRMQTIRSTPQRQCSQQAFLSIRNYGPEPIFPFFLNLKHNGCDDLRAVNLHVTIALLAK